MIQQPDPPAPSIRVTRESLLLAPEAIHDAAEKQRRHIDYGDQWPPSWRDTAVFVMARHPGVQDLRARRDVR